MTQTVRLVGNKSVSEAKEAAEAEEETGRLLLLVRRLAGERRCNEMSSRRVCMDPTSPPAVDISLPVVAHFIA